MSGEPERPRVNLEVLAEDGASEERVALATESLAMLMPCKCGAMGEPGAICPYASEIGGVEEECGCCDNCQRQCADEI